MQDDIYEDEAEVEAVDDTVIGKAFRWSLLAFVLVGGGVATGAWLLGREQAPPPPQHVERVAPSRAEESALPPAVVFTDVTQASGLRFVHENGGRGAKLLPETMGGGAAFVDVEDDGDPDLVLVNGALWPEDAQEGVGQPTQALYENDGSGRFADATARRGLDASFFGMGVAVGDADCDGDRDLYFTAVGPNRLFADGGERYAEADIGVSGAAEDWSTCAAFFDADGDGDLDLYSGNYVRWSRDIDFRVDYQLTGVGRAYGPPTNFAGADSCFYRNDDGRFVDRSAESGIRVHNPATGEPMGKALGVRPIDADCDGDVDLFVANDTVANFFFENDGEGAFAERGARMGVAFDRNGNATGAMGIDAAWFRGDDSVGFAIGNFANEMTSLYVAQETGGLYVDESIGAGIGAPSRARLSFGVCFLDYDLDGCTDLLQANGHIEDEIQTVQASQTYRQPAQLFWNAGPASRRTYAEVDLAGAGDLGRPIVGRSVLAADVDLDGDLDALLTQAGGAPLLLRNDQALGHHWLRVRLVQPGCNRDAIGARLVLESGGRRQRADVMPARGYLSSQPPSVTFGLGEATRVERLTIVWPDGTQEVREGLAVDRELVLER